MRAIITRPSVARVAPSLVAFGLMLLAFAGSAAAQGPIDLLRVAGSQPSWSTRSLQFDTPDGMVDAGILRVRDTADGIEMAFEPSDVPRAALSHPLVVGPAAEGPAPTAGALVVKPASGQPVSGAFDPTTVHMLVDDDGAVGHLLRFVPACDAAGRCAVRRVVWYAISPRTLTVDTLPATFAPADIFPIEAGDKLSISP